MLKRLDSDSSEVDLEIPLLRRPSEISSKGVGLAVFSYVISSFIPLTLGFIYQHTSVSTSEVIIIKSFVMNVGNFSLAWLYGK